MYNTKNFHSLHEKLKQYEETVIPSLEYTTKENSHIIEKDVSRTYFRHGNADINDLRK